MLASLVFHADFLRDELDSQHPLFSSRLFTGGYVERLQGKVISGVYYDPITRMTATGVPHYVQLRIMVEALTDRTEQGISLTASVRDDILKKIEAFTAALPRSLANSLLQNFSVNGAIPLTQDHLQAMIANNTEAILGQIRELLHRPHQRQAPHNDGPVEAGLAAADNNAYQLWNWGGRMHMVPQGWRLPKISSRKAWELWQFGIPSERIQPLRRLNGFDLSHTPDRVSLSRLRRVMSEMERFIIDEAMLPPGKLLVSDLSFSESTAAAELAYGKLCMMLYDLESEEDLITNRVEDKTYNTIHAQILIYNRIR